MNKKIGVIGCGKMAYAILKGITSNMDNKYDLYVSDIDKEKINNFVEDFGAISSTNKEVAEQAEIIFLAVKPTQIQDVIISLNTFFNDNQVIVSVAAGISVSKLEENLTENIPVLRVMPNTPSLLMQGVAAISPGTYVDDYHIDMVRGIFDNLGFCISIDEKYMDSITAVSGSGPAYVYLVIESMINAAINVGLDSSLARELVLNTFKGSIAMIEQTELHPAELRQQVMSPGGTTVAGVRQLEENGIRKAFFDAIEQAHNRSIELGKK
ncbi:Pyrroline-5-carboxylate reductase [Candidatus Syntrophocurvum alkaliphilum]|uniref:Pyrroline-5-carboxylate reductase n=1 Tax=Candidatus Syntrophocurvum alkaliphilum TaxID=2293317 RepID=A0A6I6DFF3_9FIRM|nr:pyrroline-5-carboxylate reductase [Candidatus Syntrophocurvum alkaliphilum]QGT99692.1 Pyrroline-5-carboxylate reductase [Candidatus Syntrophocurvum alkaliphilum]